MKKQIFLLLVAAALIFTGGFFTGFYYSSLNKQPKKVNVTNEPKSTIHLKKKQMSHSIAPNSKVVMGYIQDFRDPNSIDYSKLTHVIFSFAHPTKDGRILLNGNMALNNLKTTIKKAKKYHTKVILAVGGWFNIQGGESYPYFKAAISTPATRTKLVNELTSLVKREKLDGIDIDFEYPRSFTEAKSLTAFAKGLSDTLHAKGKELSVAVDSKINASTGTEITSVQYDPTMFKYVDHVNIMAYDGQWDGGYHAANLSPYPFARNIVTYWSKLFSTHHLSMNKLVLGVPSYAQPVNPKFKQVSYAAIIKQNPANANTDTVHMNGTTYHYNGEETIGKKIQLAVNHHFGGMMLWEEGLDAKGTYSLTRAIFGGLKEQEKNYVSSR